MFATDELNRVIDSLIRIQYAGTLRDLETKIFAETYGSQNVLDDWPDYRPLVEEISQIASRNLELPIDWCRDAVCQRVLPWTRRRAALDIIEEFDAQLPGRSQGGSSEGKVQ